VTGCTHPEHQLAAYTDEQRRLLAAVAELNEGILAAHREGLHLGGVLSAIDPDPARYMFVDEGRGTLDIQLREAAEALAGAQPIPGHRRMEGNLVQATRFAARPSIAETAASDQVIGWIEWEQGIGEHVMVSVGDDSHRLTAEPADCFRPTVTIDTSQQPWVFYARAVNGQVSVYAQFLSIQGWSDPEQVSDTGHPSFNQEAVAHPDGSIEVVWQGQTAGRFSIFSRRWTPGRGWNPTVSLDEVTSRNVWDPTLVVDGEDGTVYAWCGYGPDGYQIFIRRREGETLGEIHRVGDAGTHALHPSLAASTDGRVWCAFDTFHTPAHGGSGPTQLRAADRVGHDLGWPGLGSPGLFMPPELVPPITAALRVVELSENGQADTIGTLAAGLEITPSAYPRLAASHDGGLTVAYRVMRRLPLMTYHWEVAVQQLGPNGWGPPVTFDQSDGGLEEPAVAASSAGVIVAWKSDDRARHNATWADGFGGLECPDLREHYGEVVWHDIHEAGRIRWARISDESAGPRSAAFIQLERSSVESLTDRSANRYHTEIASQSFDLYWGDLHRHSLISRCTSGDEPSVEDMYRYAWDVSDYDFWALTDHSENSTAFQWWTIQKTADLFLVDGRFVPLYGFEWTSPHTGHQNVIFDSARRGAPIISSMAADSDTPAKLWRHLRHFPDFPSITIPHHPGSAMVPFDWSFRDEEMIRVVEIFQSCRGSYEADGAFRQYSDATLPGTFVFDALLTGHRFGLIGSSDHGYGTGYVGAFAPSLDRQEIFAALQARRTIASTTRDIVVDTRIGNTFMGAETNLSSGGPFELDLFARGRGEIARVEIVRSGEVIDVVGPDLDLPTGWLEVPVRVEWGWGPGTTDWSGSITVDGGEVVQTEYWSPEVVAFDTTSVRWSAVTTSFGEPYGNQRGGIEVTLTGPPDCLVRVETTAGRLITRLGEIVRRRVVEGVVRGEGRLRLQPGVGGLVSLGSKEVRTSHTDDRPGWYLARVYQVDGEMAWSSPIWVES
jgi:hypothetical protein